MSDPEDLPAFNEVRARLAQAVPPEQPARIVHGDYGIHNVILAEHDPGEIVAVLDWEMATIGDPLADMGLLAYRGGATSSDRHRQHFHITPLASTWEEAAALYKKKSGRPSGLIYNVLAHFKLGDPENMYKRFLGGGTVGAGFEMIGQQAILLAQRGLAVAEASSIASLRG
jgi:aminoglycoside phosphotransferase (APT) family kinase protein